MNITKHKSKSPLLREIDLYFKNGGSQIAVVIEKDEFGKEAYVFSRPFISKVVHQLEYMGE